MYAALTALLILSIFLPLLAAVTIVLRFYARKIKRIPLLVDDWLIVVAWVSTLHDRI